MASEQIVNETVKRMLDAGIDDATILSTLADIGMDEAKGKSVIDALRAPSDSIEAPLINDDTDSDAPEQAPVVDYSPQTPKQVPVQATTQDISAMKTELETQGEVHQLHQAATQNTLDLHEEKLNEFDNKVAELKQSVAASSAPAPLDPAVLYRLTELENKMSGMTSTVNATFDLMKKILETDRSILTSLEAKK